ncbi:MAG: hypothetical protein AB8H47_09770 [Bacteroidia bacterium]
MIRPFYFTALLIFCLCIGFASLRAQSDTQEPDPFGMQVSQPRMLKVDMMQLVLRQRNSNISGVLHLSYEHKVKPAWSINTEVSSPYLLGKDGTQSLLPFASGIVAVGVGPRFYPMFARLHALGERQNHLSADYVSVLIGTRLKQTAGGGSATDRTPNWYTDNVAFSLLYGIQRRIYNYLYVDFNLGLKTSYGDPSRQWGPSLNIKRWQIQPVTSLRLGVAF